MGKSKRKRSRSKSSSRERRASAIDQQQIDLRLSRLEALISDLHQDRRARSREVSHNRNRSRSPHFKSHDITSNGDSSSHRVSSLRRCRTSSNRAKSMSRSRSSSNHRQFGSRSPAPSLIDNDRSAEQEHREGAVRVSPVARESSPALLLTVDQDEILDTFLQAVGVDPQPTAGNTQLIPQCLAATWSQLLINGLPKDERDQILSLYQPHESANLKPPTLNAEIASVLSSTNKSKDFRLMGAQNHILSVLTAQACAFRSLAGLTDSSQVQKEALGKILADGAKILCSVYHSLTFARREGLYPFLSTTLKEITSKVPANSFLFGDNISEEIKKQKSLESVGRELRAPPPVSRYNTRPATQRVQAHAPLNSRGPVRPRGGGGTRSSGQYPRAQTSTHQQTQPKDSTSKKPVTNRSRRH